MAEELRLETHHKPSIFNKDMLLGALVGASVPIFGLQLGAALGVAIALTATGAIIGGIAGKNRLEKENREGKEIGKPSFWNKDTLIGGLLGYKAIGVVLMLGALATAGGTLGAAAVSGALAHGTLALGAVTTLAAMVASPFVGAYLGGKVGEKRQVHEYEEAKHQHIVRQLSHNVSPEVGQAVEYTMANNKDWGKKMLEEKLLATSQTPQPGR